MAKVVAQNGCIDQTVTISSIMFQGQNLVVQKLAPIDSLKDDIVALKAATSNDRYQIWKMTPENKPGEFYTFKNVLNEGYMCPYILPTPDPNITPQPDWVITCKDPISWKVENGMIQIVIKEKEKYIKAQGKDQPVILSEIPPGADIKAFKWEIKTL